MPSTQAKTQRKVQVHTLSDESDRYMKDLCESNVEAEIECQDSDIQESYTDTEDTILQEMQDCFGDEETCGEKLLDKVAKVADSGLRIKGTPEKIRDVVVKYLRPQNVKNLKTPKENPFTEYCDIIGCKNYVNIANCYLKLPFSLSWQIFNFTDCHNILMFKCKVMADTVLCLFTILGFEITLLTLYVYIHVQ